MHSDQTLNEYAYAAADVISTTLSGFEMDHIWSQQDRHHQNGARTLAQEIVELNGDVTKDPEIFAFMRKFSKLQAQILPSKSQEHANMLGLKTYLDFVASTDKNLSKAKLSDDHRKILDMVASHHAQNTLKRAGSTVIRGAVHQLQEIKEAAMQRPLAFSALCCASLWMWKVMNKNMGGTTTTDPNLLGFTGLETGGVYTSGITPDEYVQIKPSCHSDLSGLIGKDAADFIKDGVMGDYFPDHCSKLQTMASDVQNATWGLLERWTLVTSDPARAGADFLPESSVRQSFVDATYDAEQPIMKADGVENMIVHPPLMVTASLAGLRLSSLTIEDVQEAKEKMRGFKDKIIYQNPLSALYGLTAAFNEVVVNNGLTMDTLWGGLTAGTIGYGIHWAERRWDRKENAIKFIEPAKEGLSQFKNAGSVIEHIKSNEPVDLSDKAKRRRLSKKALKLSVIGAATTATAGVSSAIAGMLGKIDQIDSPIVKQAMVSFGDQTAYAAGQAFMWGSFVVWNIPQDILIHRVLGTACYVGGAAVGFGEKGVRNILKWSNKKLGLYKPDHAMAQDLYMSAIKPSSDEKLNDYIQSKHMSKPLSAYHAEYNGYEVLTAEQDNNYLYLASDKKPSLAEKMYEQFDGAKECPVIEAQNQNTARKPAAETYALDLALAK